MADIQLIGAREREQRAWLFARIPESRKAGRQVILFVPEQYTLQAERDLLTGLHLPGLLDLDVVSPTRLQALIRERAGSSGLRPLDEAGRAMAIQQALHDCGPDLEYYLHLDRLYGAVPRMDRTLSEFMDENLTPEMLENLAAAAPGAARRAKYTDLSKIWREYETLLSGRFEDPSAAWRDLCARLGPSGLWQGADLYVYGFDTVRPDLRELILAAAGICASVRVLLTMTDSSDPSGRIYRAQRDSAADLSAALEEKGTACAIHYLPAAAPAPEDPLGFLRLHLFAETGKVFPGDPSPALSLYAAPHPTAEALTIVSVLRAWRREGIAWNRMAIALPREAAGAGTLTAALRRHGIPFFFGQRESLGRHGVSILLTCALRCVSQGLQTEPLLEIACCGFGTLSREEGSRLAGYVRSWGIDRGRWQEPFTRGEDAEAAEELRLRLLAPLKRLHGALKEAASAAGSVEAVYRFLREEGIYDQLQSRRRRLMEEERYAAAIVDRQVWNLLMNLLDQMYHLLGGRRATLKEMSLMLEGALERAALSALPEEEDGVQIGRIGHMLPGRTEALILPGMNEGVLSLRPESLLSDAERRALEENAGRRIGLDQARMSMIIRSDYARTLSLPEKRLFVSYCLRDESGKSQLPGEPVSELRRLFPALREQGGLASREADVPPETPSLALEGLGPMLRDLRENRRTELSDPWPDAMRLLFRDPGTAPLIRRMFARLFPPEAPRSIDPDTAIRLFHGEKVSISRLECYAACPWQHFLSYGLRPLLPRAFDFTPGDAGNFYHLALQRYVDQAVGEPGWPNLDPARADALMDAVLDQLTASWQDSPLQQDALGFWQGEELLRRVRHAASVLTRFAGNSDFEVAGTEVEFGGPDGLPPLVLSLPEGDRIALQGKIDRMDLYRGPDGDFLRILDLKSSGKKLEPARMAVGEQLQLMIYLRAALRARPGLRPAGAFYFPVQDREVDSESPEEAEQKRLKEMQLKGVALEDENVLRAMDRDLSPFSLPKIFNQDGSVSKSAGWVLPSEMLEGLMDAAVRKAGELCRRIRAGEIPAAPSVSADRTPCTFCDFASACPLRKGDERPLPEGLTFADVARGTPAEAE